MPFGLFREAQVPCLGSRSSVRGVRPGGRSGGEGESVSSALAFPLARVFGEGERNPCLKVCI